VFAALGLLGAFEWRRRAQTSVARIRQRAPIVVGLVLLGLLGTSGERTDVLGHCCGMAVGLVLGLLCAWSQVHRRGPPIVWGAAALLLFAGAWTAALVAEAV
jgi:membrane associated rhomboid family serine protease